MPRKPRSFAYARQSKGEKAQENSHKYQLRELKELHERLSRSRDVPPWHEGTVTEGMTAAAVDIDQSAYQKPFFVRPEAKRLLLKLERGDWVFVWKLDRLARKITDAHSAVHWFQEHGVTLVFGDFMGYTVDTSSAMGQFMISCFAFVAQMESENIGVRTRAAMALKRERGELMTRNCPRGWKPTNRRTNRKRRLVPFDEERDWIEMCYHKWCEGWKPSAIRRWINRIMPYPRSGKLAKAQDTKDIVAWFRDSKFDGTWESVDPTKGVVHESYYHKKSREERDNATHSEERTVDSAAE